MPVHRIWHGYQQCCQYPGCDHCKAWDQERLSAVAGPECNSRVDRDCLSPRSPMSEVVLREVRRRGMGGAKTHTSVDKAITEELNPSIIPALFTPHT